MACDPVQYAQSGQDCRGVGPEHQARDQRLQRGAALVDIHPVALPRQGDGTAGACDTTAEDGDLHGAALPDLAFRAIAATATLGCTGRPSFGRSASACPRVVVPLPEALVVWMWVCMGRCSRDGPDLIASGPCRRLGREQATAPCSIPDERGRKTGK